MVTHDDNELSLQIVNSMFRQVAQDSCYWVSNWKLEGLYPLYLKCGQWAIVPLTSNPHPPHCTNPMIQYLSCSLTQQISLVFHLTVPPLTRHNLMSSTTVLLYMTLSPAQFQLQRIYPLSVWRKTVQDPVNHVVGPRSITFSIAVVTQTSCFMCTIQIIAYGLVCAHIIANRVFELGY